MKILDTNLWVFGTLRTHDRAVEELDAIEQTTIEDQAARLSELERELEAVRSDVVAPEASTDTERDESSHWNPLRRWFGLS